MGESIKDFVEVKSGRKSNRPELALALSYAKKKKATLLFAKLDRLARNVYFISGFMASGIDFVACDMPSANKLTIHILAAVVENVSPKVQKPLLQQLRLVVWS